MTRTATLILVLAAGLAPAQSRFALVVGIDNYDPAELKSLRFAASDAADLARTLRASGYRDEDVVLMTPQRGAEAFRFAPTAEHVRKELALLLQSAKPEDSVVVAFAGHGVQFRGDDEVFFCPVDAKLADRGTLLSLRVIYEQLAACPARFKLLLSDACRDDPRANVARSPTVEIESKTRPQKVEPPRGVVALFACAAGGKAFESGLLRHGIFFFHVIEALQGRGDANRDQRVTLNELDDFVQVEVARTSRIEFASEQTPQRIGSTVGQPPPLVVLAAPVAVPVVVAAVAPPVIQLPPKPVVRQSSKRPPALAKSNDGYGIYRSGPTQLACYAPDADLAADPPVWTFDVPPDVRQVSFGGTLRQGKVIVVTEYFTAVLSGEGVPLAEPKPLRLAGPVEKIDFDPRAFKFTLYSGRQQTRIGN